jgi:hypothetical protein
VLVRQVQVKQQQIRTQPVHRRDGLGCRMDLGDHLETVHLADVGGMDAGDTEVVVDDHWQPSDRGVSGDEEESVMGVAKKAKYEAKAAKSKARKDAGKVKHKGKKVKNAAKH